MGEENITPEKVYLNRKTFMKAGGAFATTLLLDQCFPDQEAREKDDGLARTPEKYALNYNNYYEFSTSKEAVADLAEDFPMDPWSLKVGGLVEKELTLDLKGLRGLPVQNRVYRFRCVEGWSMVLPWSGFRLADLLSLVKIKPEAKFVRFETIMDPKHMPGQKDKWYDWPYVEGLRLDEAQHDLTLMATGLYGKYLAPQSGGPVRLIVPWKYGFKSAKAIVKIELVKDMPESLWMKANPREYGFYSNVNPAVPHPRWSQASERRIGEFGRIPTLPFNGYEKEVAHLYRGMDLKKWF